MPIGSETAAVPANHRFRLDHGDRVKQRWEESVQPHQDDSNPDSAAAPEEETCGLESASAGAKPEFQPEVSPESADETGRRAEL